MRRRQEKARITTKDAKDTKKILFSLLFLRALRVLRGEFSLSCLNLYLCNLRNLWFLVLLFLTLGRGRQPALCSFRVPCLSGVRQRVMTIPGRDPVGLPSSTTNTPPTST